MYLSKKPFRQAALMCCIVIMLMVKRMKIFKDVATGCLKSEFIDFVCINFVKNICWTSTTFAAFCLSYILNLLYEKREFSQLDHCSFYYLSSTLFFLLLFAYIFLKGFAGCSFLFLIWLTCVAGIYHT